LRVRASPGALTHRIGGGRFGGSIREGHIGRRHGNANAQAQRGRQMRSLGNMKEQPENSKSGKIGWIFLWLIGVPVPILLILFLMRGCT
jgi:hypothetical protein